MTDTRRVPSSIAPAIKSRLWVTLHALGAYGACEIIGSIVLPRSATGAIAVQAAVAEWVAGRAGMRWSQEQSASTRAIGIRVAKGGAIGVGSALLALALAMSARESTIHTSTIALAEIAAGLIAAAAYAARDELVLRGFVVTLTTGAFTQLGPKEIPGAASEQSSSRASARTERVAIAACAATSVAAAIGHAPAVAPIALLVSAVTGALFGQLWMIDRGAWMAWGANFAWTFVTRTIFGGAVFEVQTSGDGRHGFAAGRAGIAAMATIFLTLLFFRQRARARRIAAT